MSSITGTSFLPNPSSPTATSSSTATSTSTSTASPGTSNGTPASATLLFGFLVIFIAIFAAFLLLAILWQYQRRRREAAAGTSQSVMLEFDESKGTYRGVPSMWEVWIQHEPSTGDHWEWENVRPLSVDIDNTSSGQPIAQANQSRRPRRNRSHNLFRRRPVPLQTPPAPVPPPPQEAQQQQQHVDVTSASAPALISGVRMSFVIAMPNADAPTNRRRSVISQVSCVRESWRHREFALGIYHPPFREDCAL